MVLQSSAAIWASSGSPLFSLSNAAARTPAIIPAFQVTGEGGKEVPIFLRTLTKVPIKCLDLQHTGHILVTQTSRCSGDWEMSCTWVPRTGIEVGVLLLREMDHGDNQQSSL